jgi:hypothetical protein
MSFDEAVPNTEAGEVPAHTIPLTEFVSDFGDGLLAAVTQQNPPVYDGRPDPQRDAVMEALKRKPFAAQRGVVQSVARLLIDAGEPAAVVNAEMGTGKTMMAIAIAAVLHRCEGYRRCLVISPPHLVYKWRREILETIGGARVTVLNGPDTLRKLLQLRDLARPVCEGPEFFVLGRVRMRLGFHWKPAYTTRKRRIQPTDDHGEPAGSPVLQVLVCCAQCGAVSTDADEIPYTTETFPSDKRLKSAPANHRCGRWCVPTARRSRNASC